MNAQTDDNNRTAVAGPVERQVRPLSETVRPLAWMSREGFAELRGCNGVSVWCENAALYEHPTEAHPSLMPVYDMSVAEAWRAFGMHAEREREVLKDLALRSRAQLRKWAEWYGSADHAARGQLPLPPSGDVELAEDISAALGPNATVNGRQQHAPD